MGVYYPDVYQKECIKHANFQTSGLGEGGQKIHSIMWWILQSDIPQSKLLLGTRGDVQLATHVSFSKKLQQALSKRLKHIIRPVLQAGLQAIYI